MFCCLYVDMLGLLGFKEVKKVFLDFYYSFLEKIVVFWVLVFFNVVFEFDCIRVDFIFEDV